MRCIYSYQKQEERKMQVDRTQATLLAILIRQELTNIKAQDTVPNGFTYATLLELEDIFVQACQSDDVASNLTVV
jgi:hypothetical protein